MQIFLSILLFIFYSFCFLSGSHCKNSPEDDSAVQRKLSPKIPVRPVSTTGNVPNSNNLTYIFVTGVDNIAVNTVTPFVSAVAKTCGQHLIYNNVHLRSSHLKAQSFSYVSYLRNMKMSNLGTGNTKEVTVVVHATLPDEELLDSSIYQKKAMHKYNIEWLYDQAELVGDVKQRYLYATRNFYETVSSRLRGREEVFAQWVQALNDFQSFIDMEHSIINKKAKEDLWRQVSYEWFREMRNCTALVSAVIDFAGWNHCDVDFACQILPELLYNTTTASLTVSSTNESTVVDAERVQYAESHTMQLKIPALDITPKTEYQHSTLVSARTLPFNLQSDASPPGTPPVRRLPPLRNIDRPPAVPAGAARNNVSFLYIVGVEGTGHHGVTPAIASIAKTCNYHVIYESTVLRSAGVRLHSRTYQAGLNTHKKLKYSGTRKVLIIEDQSFPTDNERRVSSMKAKKASGKYNLEWMYDRTVDAGIDMRFLYLTRDFYKAVASHPEFDVTFHRHADVLRDFIWYINSEYELISRKKEGLWRQVSFEWFREMRNCTALVSAVIDFAGWNHCDVDFACQILGQTLRNSTKRAVNKTELAYARSMNVSLPIPVLDITPNQTFAFETAVSARVPFSFLESKAPSKKHSVRLRTRTNLPNKQAPTKSTATTASASAALSLTPLSLLFYLFVLLALLLLVVLVVVPPQQQLPVGEVHRVDYWCVTR